MLWSRSAEQLYGYTAEQTIGMPIKIVPPEGQEELRALYERALSGESVRDVEARRRRQDGSFVDVRIAAAPMYHPDGTVRGVAWAHEDITDRKRAEEQLKRLAHYDPLTGLPNRLSLQKELERLLSADRNRPTSIALFDLDGFKDVNDTLGHSIGDQLLIEVGQRLIESTERRSETDQVFRLGGDEFVVIIPDCGDPRVVGESVDAMLKRLAEPFRISEQALHLGGSAGVAIAPNDGTTVDDLIANADLALYQAKSEGGRTYRLFMPIFGPRPRPGAGSTSSCGGPSRRTSSSCIFSRKSASPTAPWSGRRRCCDGGIRSGVSWRRGCSSIRSPTAPSRRTSAAGSSTPPVRRRRPGAPWGCRSVASASICFPRSCMATRC